MYSRFSKLPSLFVENYESILVVMTILGSEIRRGKGVNGNCHSVARALATIFPNFRVADGYVYSVSPPACDETHGPRSSLINEIEKKPESVRFKRLCHSWLVWTWLKQDTNLIIDAWPIGGGMVLVLQSPISKTDSTCSMSRLLLRTCISNRYIEA